MTMIVDIDKLFKKFVVEFLTKNKGKYSEEELNEKVESLYSDFALTTFEELDGLTPSTFYENKQDKLVEILTEHFKKGVPVSEYLIAALKKYEKAENLLPLLSDKVDSSLIVIALECLFEKNVKIDDNVLIDLLFSEKTDENVKNYVGEHLEENISCKDALLHKALQCDHVSGAVLEILSGMDHCDEIKAILEREFLSNLEKAPEYCSYIVEYSDESLLDALYKGIETVDDYVSYKEIALAIDALGGTVNVNKDFSNDKNYIKIKEAGKNEHKTDN